MKEGTCWHCGYDLTGLARSGACPECGGAIDDAAAAQARRDRAARHQVATFMLALLVLAIVNLVLYMPYVRFAQPLVFALLWAGTAVLSFLLGGRPAVMALPIAPRATLALGCILSMVAVCINVACGWIMMLGSA